MTDGSSIGRRAFMMAAGAAGVALLPARHFPAAAMQLSGARMPNYPVLLDHLVWLAEDLDAACAQFEQMSGVKAEYGGQHPGGTHNALVGLGPLIYLEIVAPQPGAEDGHPWVAAARRRPEPHLYSYCMRTPGSLSELAYRIEAAGHNSIGPSGGSRRLPGGELLEWELLIPLITQASRAIPFHIDWGESPHPAQGSRSEASLTSFAVEHPDPDSVRPILDLLAPGVQIKQSQEEIGLRAELATPNGVVVLEG